MKKALRNFFRQGKGTRVGDATGRYNVGDAAGGYKDISGEVGAALPPETPTASFTSFGLVSNEESSVDEKSKPLIKSRIDLFPTPESDSSVPLALLATQTHLRGMEAWGSETTGTEDPVVWKASFDETANPASFILEDYPDDAVIMLELPANTTQNPIGGNSEVVVEPISDAPPTSSPPPPPSESDELSVFLSSDDEDVGQQYPDIEVSTETVVGTTTSGEDEVSVAAEQLPLALPEGQVFPEKVAGSIAISLHKMDSHFIAQDGKPKKRSFLADLFKKREEKKAAQIIAQSNGSPKFTGDELRGMVLPTRSPDEEEFRGVLSNFSELIHQRSVLDEAGREYNLKDGCEIFSDGENYYITSDRGGNKGIKVKDVGEINCIASIKKDEIDKSNRSIKLYCDPQAMREGLKRYNLLEGANSDNEMLQLVVDGLANESNTDEDDTKRKVLEIIAPYVVIRYEAKRSFKVLENGIEVTPTENLPPRVIYYSPGGADLKSKESGSICEGLKNESSREQTIGALRKRFTASIALMLAVAAENHEGCFIQEPDELLSSMSDDDKKNFKSLFFSEAISAIEGLSDDNKAKIGPIFLQISKEETFEKSALEEIKSSLKKIKDCSVLVVKDVDPDYLDGIQKKFGTQHRLGSKVARVVVEGDSKGVFWDGWKTVQASGQKKAIAALEVPTTSLILGSLRGHIGDDKIVKLSSPDIKVVESVESGAARHLDVSSLPPPPKSFFADPSHSASAPPLAPPLATDPAPLAPPPFVATAPAPTPLVPVAAPAPFVATATATPSVELKIITCEVLNTGRVVKNNFPASAREYKYLGTLGNSADSVYQSQDDIHSTLYNILVSVANECGLNKKDVLSVIEKTKKRGGYSNSYDKDGKIISHEAKNQKFARFSYRFQVEANLAGLYGDDKDRTDGTRVVEGLSLSRITDEAIEKFKQLKAIPDDVTMYQDNYLIKVLKVIDLIGANRDAERGLTIFDKSEKQRRGGGASR